MLCELLSVYIPHPIMFIPVTIRVRNNIREGHPDYTVTADSWPSFLYPRAKGDVNDIERGLFRSAILLKVRIILCHKRWCACSLLLFRLINSSSPRLRLRRTLNVKKM
jgi:hypothetical protein